MLGSPAPALLGCHELLPVPALAGGVSCGADPRGTDRGPLSQPVLPLPSCPGPCWWPGWGLSPPPTRFLPRLLLQNLLTECVAPHMDELGTVTASAPAPASYLCKMFRWGLWGVGDAVPGLQPLPGPLRGWQAGWHGAGHVPIAVPSLQVGGGRADVSLPRGVGRGAAGAGDLLRVVREAVPPRHEEGEPGGEAVRGQPAPAAPRSPPALPPQCLQSLCDLRLSPHFPYTAEVDQAVGAAVAAMGPEVLLEAVPLQIDGKE